MIIDAIFAILALLPLQTRKQSPAQKLLRMAIKPPRA